jgi:carboxymethylenebutenolidase
VDEYLTSKGLNRRDFHRLTSAATLTFMLPFAARAAEITGTDVRVTTPDGDADCYFVHPVDGAHAGVILWPDVMGLRPSYRTMADRLAHSGYSVLVPNPYYRVVAGRVTPEGRHISEPEIRALITPYRQSVNAETCVIDGRAFVAWLDQQAAVDSARKMGVMGYCMSGSYALRIAADMPDRIGAGASFHGGGLATDAEDSPHLLVPAIRAGMLIAIAENDDASDPNAKVLLREAFDKSGGEAEIEVYAGAMHGWCPPDSPVFNEAQATRAWSRMLNLFERRLI